MAQGILPFKYETEKKTTGMTALGGLPAYLDLAQVVGLSKSIQQHLKVRAGGQGWTDSQMVLALVLLNLAGGDCVEDVKVLEADDGFCEILKKVEMHGLRRKVRRALLRRWRKERTRAVPSPSAIFRYLAQFHDEQQEGHRQPGKAFIPAANENLSGFVGINKDLARFSSLQQSDSTATLDMDATLVATSAIATPSTALRPRRALRFTVSASRRCGATKCPTITWLASRRRTSHQTSAITGNAISHNGLMKCSNSITRAHLGTVSRTRAAGR